MSAFFNFNGLLIVVILIICTFTYVKGLWPNLLKKKTKGFREIFRKAAVIGQRLSPIISIICIGLSFHNLIFRK